jgi:mRNA deadenylase 3'-5' endonuclease subunit Ccr4
MPCTNAWTGRLVARLLPPHVDGDFAQTKPILRRIEASPLLEAHASQSLRGPPPPMNLTDVLTKNGGSVVTFDICITSIASGETAMVHMNRDVSEAVEKTMTRMAISLGKKIIKGKVKKIEAEAKLWKRVNICATSVAAEEWEVNSETNEEVWRKAAVDVGTDISISLKLEQETVQLMVESCPPTICAVRTFEDFCGRLFDGIPLVIEVDTLYSSHAIVDWYCGGIPVCSDTLCYTPSAADVGKLVTVIVTPVRPGQDGEPEAYRFIHAVEGRPRNTILSIRPNWQTRTRRLENTNGIRVMSYNILADLNAFSGQLGTSFYPYCSAEVLDRKRRMPLLLQEIMAYQADVICLQEVDASMFRDLFKPVLKHFGYQGYFSCKVGGSREGCATFWSLDTFERLDSMETKTHKIRDLFSTEDALEDWTSMHDICRLLDQHCELRSVMLEKLGHVLQTVCLTLKNQSSRVAPPKLIIANTHLFFHPMASHIRLMQLYATCHQIEKERGRCHPLVYCGDFNSSPTSGAARLISERSVAPIQGSTDLGATWKHLNTFTWGQNYIDAACIPADAPQPITIALPESFPRLISGYEQCPPLFTHYICGFIGSLDYIWASNDLIATECAEMPSVEQITEHVAMPSQHLPSDHVALVCEFQLGETYNP